MILVLVSYVSYVKSVASSLNIQSSLTALNPIPLEWAPFGQPLAVFRFLRHGLFSESQQLYGNRVNLIVTS